MFAIHLSDGLLSLPACGVGGVAALLLMLIGGWRLRDEEVSRIAVLAAVFLVASLVRLHVPGGSVHLLLNGIVGLVLGWRAALAIPLGLTLQALLFQHGGLLVLGVNCVVMVLPAWAAGAAFALGRRWGWWARAWVRTVGGICLGSGAVLLTALGYWVALFMGGEQTGDLASVGYVVLAAHLPLAALEGGLTAILVSALWRAKPELFTASAKGS